MGKGSGNKKALGVRSKTAVKRFFLLVYSSFCKNWNHSIIVYCWKSIRHSDSKQPAWKSLNVCLPKALQLSPFICLPFLSQLITDRYGLFAVFSTEGTFFTATSELPGVDVQNGTNIFQKGHWGDLFDIKSSSGSAEVLLLFERRRTLNAS